MKVSSNQSRIMADQYTGQIKQVTATCTLKPNELVSHVTVVTTAIVVTLPPVAEAAGKIYTIRTVAAGNGAGVDVISGGDHLHASTEGSTVVNVASAFAIDAANDYVLMYSDGYSWYCLAFNQA